MLGGARPVLGGARPVLGGANKILVSLILQVVKGGKKNPHTHASLLNLLNLIRTSTTFHYHYSGAFFKHKGKDEEI